ncbi:MAG: beta-galactosidase [Candidatus Sericytochromatia bacterium]|nr:beta-galactosidase [Candidatus Sericytochromatia bacterium]
MSFVFEDRHIFLNGSPSLVVGGEFQYFRIPRERWRSSLVTLRDAGLMSVSAYVPWVWHAPEVGTYDFVGNTDPARDLVAFLELCAELGLPVIAKPGPFIFAEYQGFGIPLWLPEEFPDVLMMVHKPQAFPQPALNHPSYLALVEDWFRAVADILRPFVERGVVVALQIDNETGYPQFGQGPHLTDRNPETLTLLRLVLAEHFGTIQALNAQWGTAFESFESVEPPEEKLFTSGQIESMARWVEDYIVQYLGRLKTMWEKIDLGVHLFLNDIWLDSWPSHIGKKNQVAPLAYDIYPRYSHLPILFDQPYSISYVPKLFGAFVNRGPLIAAELGAGWLDPVCEVKPSATFLSTMAAYAHGTQACYYYILADGTDPDGDYEFRSFLDLQGDPTSRLDALRRVADFSREWGPRVAPTREVFSSVAILHNPAVTREMMAAAIDPLGAMARGSQRPIDEVVTIVSVNAGLFGALLESGYHPRVCNLDHVSLDELLAIRVVFFNSIGTLDPKNRRKLEHYVEQGGTLVTLGTPFEENTFLFPAVVERVRNPRSWWVMGHIAWDFVKFYARLGRSFRHRLCAYTMEGMHPAMLLTRYATRAGLWLREQADKMELWSSRLITLCRPSKPVQPLLWLGREVAGYQTDHGAGRSVFIGTLLGAAFDSPGYYLDPSSRKQSVISFLRRHMSDWGVQPLVSAPEGLEVVLREDARVRVVYILNRHQAAPFSLTFDVPWVGWRFESVWGYTDPPLDWDGQRLAGRIEAEDALVVLWERDDP